jgi:hypothetical protein
MVTLNHVVRREIEWFDEPDNSTASVVLWQSSI